jgi:hypothetical protein
MKEPSIKAHAYARTPANPAAIGANGYTAVRLQIWT